MLALHDHSEAVADQQDVDTARAIDEPANVQSYAVTMVRRRPSFRGYDVRDGDLRSHDRTSRTGRKAVSAVAHAHGRCGTDRTRAATVGRTAPIPFPSRSSSAALARIVDD
jgi:hypothetical protein